MKGPRHSLFWLTPAAAATFFALGSRADNFGKVRYDRQTDRMIVTMIYRGTNPNHNFSLKWGECQASESGSMPCSRPLRVTLRSAPRFIYTLTIPK